MGIRRFAVLLKVLSVKSDCVFCEFGIGSGSVNIGRSVLSRDSEALMPSVCSKVNSRFFSFIGKAMQRLVVVGLISQALILMSPSPGWADVSVNEGSLIEDDLAFLKEEEVVVTAILQEQPISESPSNMYVITAEDIQHSGAIDIPTLLRRVPGMEVMQTTGAEYNVSVRGNNQIGSNKLLIQIDGRSVYLDAAGRVIWRLLPIEV